MKYFDELTTQDRLAINAFFTALKEHSIAQYELYESPLLYIIYVEEEVYFQMEKQIERISHIIGENSCELTKPILCAPASFKASYEQKVDTDEQVTWDMGVTTNLSWKDNVQYVSDNECTFEDVINQNYKYTEEINSDYNRVVSISIKDSYGYAA